MIFALLMDTAIPFTAFTVLVLWGPSDMFWELFKDTMLPCSPKPAIAKGISTLKIFEVVFFFSSSPRYVSTAERKKGCDLNVDAAELLSSLSWQAWKFEIHCLRRMPLVMKNTCMITLKTTQCVLCTVHMIHRYVTMTYYIHIYI